MLEKLLRNWYFLIRLKEKMKKEQSSVTLVTRIVSHGFEIEMLEPNLFFVSPS